MVFECGWDGPIYPRPVCPERKDAQKGRLAYKLLPEEVKAELNAFIGSLKQTVSTLVIW